MASRRFLPPLLPRTSEIGLWCPSTRVDTMAMARFDGTTSRALRGVSGQSQKKGDGMESSGDGENNGELALIGPSFSSKPVSIQTRSLDSHLAHDRDVDVVSTTHLASRHNNLARRAAAKVGRQVVEEADRAYYLPCRPDHGCGEVRGFTNEHGRLRHLVSATDAPSLGCGWGMG